MSMFDDLQFAVARLKADARHADREDLLPRLIVLSPYGWALLRRDYNWHYAQHRSSIFEPTDTQTFMGLTQIVDHHAPVPWTVMLPLWADPYLREAERRGVVREGTRFVVLGRYLGAAYRDWLRAGALSGRETSPPDPPLSAPFAPDPPPENPS